LTTDDLVKERKGSSGSQAHPGTRFGNRVKPVLKRKECGENRHDCFSHVVDDIRRTLKESRRVERNNERVRMERGASHSPEEEMGRSFGQEDTIKREGRNGTSMGVNRDRLGTQESRGVKPPQGVKMGVAVSSQVQVPEASMRWLGPEGP